MAQNQFMNNHLNHTHSKCHHLTIFIQFILGTNRRRRRLICILLFWEKLRLSLVLNRCAFVGHMHYYEVYSKLIHRILMFETLKCSVGFSLNVFHFCFWFKIKDNNNWLYVRLIVDDHLFISVVVLVLNVFWYNLEMHCNERC